MRPHWNWEPPQWLGEAEKNVIKVTKLVENSLWILSVAMYNSEMFSINLQRRMEKKCHQLTLFRALLPHVSRPCRLLPPGHTGSKLTVILSGNIYLETYRSHNFSKPYFTTSLLIPVQLCWGSSPFPNWKNTKQTNKNSTNPFMRDWPLENHLLRCTWKKCKNPIPQSNSSCPN